MIFMTCFFAMLQTASAGNATSSMDSLNEVEEVQSEHQLTFHPDAQRIKLGGLDVVIWQPDLHTGKLPVVIFSHGFRGGNRSYTFLMRAFAKAGYLVIAQNHKDAIRNGIAKQQVRFTKFEDWSETTYRDREIDIRNLLASLHTSPEWNSKIDWSKVALAGHSLGGYTVLGLAGAWSSWKLPDVKAVIALAPYSNPFLHFKMLPNITVPVMYQSGTRDFWIDSFIKGRKGAYSQTPSPAVFVELNASHFAWTDLSSNRKQKELISHYCLEFLDKYVREKITAHPEQQLEGVTLLESK